MWASPFPAKAGNHPFDMSEKATNKQTNKPQPTRIPPERGGERSPDPGDHLPAAGSVEDQISRLSDTRLAPVQRQKFASQISRLSGNQHLQRIITQVQRVDDPPPSFNLGWFGDLTTYEQLAAAGQFGIGQLQAAMRDAPAGRAVDRAQEWIDGIEGWLPYLREQGEAPLTEAAVAQAELHFEEFTAAREGLEAAKRRAVRDQMARVAREARAAAREAERLKPHMDDCLRAAFRTGDSSAIADMSSTVGSVLDIGLGLHDLARESATAVMELADLDVPAVGRYVTALNRLNQGLAVLNLAFSLAQTQATTRMEESMRQLTVATGAFSSLATLAGLPAHMGLYANLYLVPMTNAIMAGISRLTSLLQRENDIWVEITGDILRPDVEPGGRPMWDFMVQVMRVRSFLDMPAIPEAVDDYMVEHQDQIDAGTDSTVPTSGYFRWESLTEDEAPAWIFNNRERLWAIFYGSRSVPEPRR